MTNSTNSPSISRAAIRPWVKRLCDAPPFALEVTNTGMMTLADDIDRIRTTQVTAQVLDDPLMTLQVLAGASRRKGGRMASECTTITNALMLYGTGPFFKAFTSLPSLESHLAEHKPALERLMELIHCARHASIQARDFVTLRKDREPEEAAIAGLLVDFPEMLLCLAAPNKIAELESARHITEDDEAEITVFGFALRELREPLAIALGIPETLRELIDDSRKDQRRVACVHIATDLAHHLEHGSPLEQMDSDLRHAAEWLHLPAEEMSRIVERNASIAAERSPGRQQKAETQPIDLVRHEDAIREMDAHHDSSLDLHHMMMLALRGIHEGAGMRRALFMLLSADRKLLRPRLWLGIEPADPLTHFSLALDPPNLFTRLLERMQAVAMNPARMTAMAQLITPEIESVFTETSWFAMSLHLGGRPVGIVYADQGTFDPRTNAQQAFDAERYELFKSTCIHASKGLSHLSARKGSDGVNT
jgi:hypothetical protein